VQLSRETLRAVREVAADAIGVLPALGRTVNRAMNEQSAALSFSAPRTIFNQPITGSRRFAAQSWPIDRIRQVSKAAGCTLNDVVLALCSGALRAYLLGEDALPDVPLIAMVPVSLRGGDVGGDGGNAVGLVLCNLGTHLADPAERLQTVHRSMIDGKAALATMTPLQILAMSAIGISPLGVYPLLGLNGRVRPPFNLIISNVPGPGEPLYWNGARLDGLYPASVVLHGQALNITVTSYSAEIAFGLTACRRTLPHMQRLLTYLDRELTALEDAADLL
jgi:diacylglycerol O-acyltransferase